MLDLKLTNVTKVETILFMKKPSNKFANPNKSGLNMYNLHENLSPGSIYKVIYTYYVRLILKS